ncbi:Phage head morphogenesis domain [uncultured Caudovirales phage]|uniref:Phage head morphogenesis domain n=1 Tax=uncultured Caudovirales phage TaxID=2100421 RepID=A0A6J7WAG2_9CAUD|nr:Phage head morphogenesis domain [uncultured Caudovirales phage]
MKLLTPKRERWAQSRGNVTFKGLPLYVPLSVEKRYEAEILNLLKAVHLYVMQSIEGLYDSDAAEEYFAQDASMSGAAKKAMAKLQDKASKHIKDGATAISIKMMSSVNKDSKIKLSASIKELSGGMNVKLPEMPGDMKDIFEATIQQNVGLIKSVGDQYLSRVEGIVMRSITEGKAGIESDLQKEFDVSKRRARLIAMDQTRKAYNTVNVERSKSLGITKGIWVHTAGSKEPRHRHKDYNGKEFNLADGAPVGNNNEFVQPGQEINCRCTFIPVLEFGED